MKAAPVYPALKQESIMKNQALHYTITRNSEQDNLVGFVRLHRVSFGSLGLPQLQHPACTGTH